VKRDFDLLETEIAEQLEMLEQAGTNRALTKEEKLIVSLFKKKLSKTKTEITSKLDKIAEELE
jgi:hypothetical protein